MVDEYKFPDELDTSNETDISVDAEGDIEVEVVDDTPEKDRGRKPLDKPVEEPTEDELAAYSDKVQARIKELTHARHDERRQKEALLREKQELERVTKALIDERKRLKQYVNTGEQQFVATYKESAQRELDMAKKAYKEAYETADSDALVEAQEAITEAKLKLQRADNFKPTPLQDDDYGVESTQVDTSQTLDDKTVRWQARNQWFGAEGYEDATSYALGLHKKLVASGVDPRSDSYYEQIDARMKSKFPEYFGADDKPNTGSRKPQTVVAPAARSTGAKRVTLTSTQIALAKKWGLTPHQYAIEIVKLEKANG